MWKHIYWAAETRESEYKNKGEKNLAAAEQDSANKYTSMWRVKNLLSH